VASLVLDRGLAPEEGLTMRAVKRSSLKPLARGPWLIGILLLGVGTVHGQAVSSSLPPGNGRELVATACSQCHGLALIVTLRDGAAGWKDAVDNMILRGAQLEPQEEKTVISYLANSFGPGNNPMRSGAGTVSLPNGPGKELIESRCTVCHDAGRITAANRTKEEWDVTVTHMLARGSIPATAEEARAMASYLAGQFGKTTAE
jgi:mono/diheme cytochrome c family protein